MLDGILDGMLAQHATSSCSPTAQEYLRKRIQQSFGASIAWHLESAFAPRLGTYLDWLRRKTESWDFLADVAHEWVILASSPLRFHYVEFMMRQPRLARPTLLLVKAYIWARAKF